MIPELPKHWKKLAAAPPTLRKPHEAITHTQGSGTHASLESNPGNAPLETKEVQGPAAGRFLVRVTSVRKRLADEDGLCEKYLVDCCRYAGLLPDDSPDICSIETRQRKVAKGEEEHTMIEIYQEDTASAIEAVRRELL